MVAALTRAKAEVGLPPDATAEQARDAFRKIFKDPDHGGDLDIFRTFLSCWESAQRLFALLEGEGKSRPSVESKAVKATAVKDSHLALPARIVIVTKCVEAEEIVHDDMLQSGSATGSDSSLPPFPTGPQRPRATCLPSSPTFLAHLTACAVPFTDEEEEGSPPSSSSLATCGLTMKRPIRTSTSPAPSRNLPPARTFAHRKSPLPRQPHNNKSNQSKPVL